MRTIEFHHTRYEVPERETLASFAERTFAISQGGPIPPLWVMNAVLSAGRDADGVTWEPFDVTPAEWDEVVHELEARGGRYVEPPTSVHTVGAWSAWWMARQTGIPAAQLLSEADRDAAVQREIRAALAAGDRERAELLHVAYVTGELPVAELMRHWAARRDPGERPPA